ncbi:MAG TPA: dienelactone hydrolase family protein [Ignavibacteriaceae bacterium]|nr:dienelactone hydrolase family protein [Ignavibacteriaceae bacterium]
MNRLTIFSILLINIAFFQVYDGEMIGAQTQPAKGDNKVRKTGIKNSTVKYISGNDTASSYLAEPDGNGHFPALIVIHEWWGLNEEVKKNADKLADSGYTALAIDLYHGKSADTPEEARRLSGSVQQEQAAMDLQAAFNYLKNLKTVDKNNIGSIGWCFGGGYSLRAALDLPGLSACVICYGRLINDVDQLRKIKCPVLGIFGEKDQGITPTIVKAFEDSLNIAGIKNKIIIYPGVSHAFMNPNNSGLHQAETTEKAWKEIFAFLDNNLKY